MPLRRDVPAEPLDVADDYGLNELGENHLSLDEVYAKVAEARNWWICTTGRGSRPHAVPVWGVVVEDQILFCTDRAATKSRNLFRLSELVLHLESGDDVVIIEATAVLVPGANVPTAFADAYDAKYDFRPDPTQETFTTFEVVPRKILAWQEDDFAGTAARWLFD